jgi:hypothetical protein
MECKRRSRPNSSVSVVPVRAGPPSPPCRAGQRSCGTSSPRRRSVLTVLKWGYRKRSGPAPRMPATRAGEPVAVSDGGAGDEGSQKHAGRQGANPDGLDVAGGAYGSLRLRSHPKELFPFGKPTPNDPTRPILRMSRFPVSNFHWGHCSALISAPPDRTPKKRNQVVADGSLSLQEQPLVAPTVLR